LRRGLVPAALVLLVLLPGSLVPVAGVLRSPEQVLAAASEPPPAVVTAPVEHRVLSETLVLPGRAAVPASVPLVPVVAEGGAAVVTGAPKRPGDTVRHGDVVAVIAGRPVLALQGALPAYRDLRPGDHGVDVAQLHAALRLAGLDADDGDVFGEGTEAAVRALYERSGFRPPLTSAALDDELEAADRRVREAERALEAARADALRAGRERDQELERAEREVALARDAVAVTGAEAEGAVRVAGAEVDRALAMRARLDADQEATDDERGAAGVEVVRAEAELDAVRVRAAAAVRQAEEHLHGTTSAVARARAEQHATSGVDSAAEDLAQAQDERVRVRRTSGAMLPRSEFLYVPALPSRVATFAATVGAPSPADGPLLTVASGDVMVSAIASSAQHTLLEEGLEVTVTGAGESHDFDGRIASVGTESVDRDGLQGFEIWVETDAPLPPEVFGYALEVRAALRATPRAVLAVPVTALSTRADGAVTVVKATGEEAAPFTVVVVRPGLSAGGFVEIAPLEGDLRRGDRVVVSR
jgi:hypothetical protein